MYFYLNCSTIIQSCWNKIVVILSSEWTLYSFTIGHCSPINDPFCQKKPALESYKTYLFTSYHPINNLAEYSTNRGYNYLSNYLKHLKNNWKSKCRHIGNKLCNPYLSLRTELTRLWKGVCGKGLTRYARVSSSSGEFCHLL